VARDGTLWRGTFAQNGSLSWEPLPLPPDGLPGRQPKVKPLPGMVVGNDRVLTAEDIERYGGPPAAPPALEI
jgi:hypothetical protein